MSCILTTCEDVADEILRMPWGEATEMAERLREELEHYDAHISNANLAMAIHKWARVCLHEQSERMSENEK